MGRTALLLGTTISTRRQSMGIRSNVKGTEYSTTSKLVNNLLRPVVDVVTAVGRCNVLVATDVAQRGLDIKNVEWVVNYDMPK